MNEKIELLAPVGSFEALYAAIQNGANAVYLGGKVFNARHYASNFDFEQMVEAVNYAHLRDVKVYVTVNILLDDSELEEALDYIKFLYEIDVDGIIVQDLGLASIIREFFPDLEVHGSTQMTINNLPGAEFLYHMGFTRVVLARETPIDEIKYIHEKTPIELEAFIHGALCMSYSGQCLMSSIIGGRSGNRGRCAQPCRMAYSIVDKKGNLLNNWDKKYLLSTKDLNTLDNIQELIDSGIISLKIEGRMKRPEYVATVVGNYRKVIDMGSSSLSLDDKRDVEQIFNRGFTKGLSFGDFGKLFSSIDRPDNRGILVGKVANVDKYKVYISLEDDVEEGDGLELEVANGEYKGILVPYKGKKGTSLALEKPGYILKDSLVYKTSSIDLLNRAKLSYSKENIKHPIDMEVEIKIGKRPRLMIKSKGKIIDVEIDKIVEKGEKVSLSEEKVVEQLSKLGDTVYTINNIIVNLDDNSYLPVSSINQLRREGIEKLDTILKNKNQRKPIDEKLYKEKKKDFFTYKDIKRETDNKISIKVSSLDQFNQLDLSKLDRIYLGFYDNLDLIIDKINDYNKEIFIWTDKILYQKDLDLIGEKIEPIKNKVHGISVSNIGSLKYFKDRFDLKIHGDIGLNIFNSFTLKYLRDIGLDSLTLSPELNLGQISKLKDKTNTFTEALVYGYLPLMISKYCPMSVVKGCKDDKNCDSCNFAKGYGLKDRLGMTFYMERKQGSSTIYNSVPILVLDSLNQIFSKGISMARLDFTIEKENIREIQSIHYDHSKGLVDKDEVREFINRFKEKSEVTKGHFFRGVM
ncbi:MAG: U32 family peptidase [Tissierellia bacterium]|nr:U32 family peptidase [Tissierellia bacterium]